MGKQSKKKGNFLTSAHQALQRKGVVTTVYLVLRLLVILVMVAQFFNRNFENVFLCAAIGFSLVDLCNRHERFSLSLSPVFMAIVAFCFSMTIGVLWEFFECAMDQFFLLDMQKDTVISSISSVLLDPTGRQRPFAIHGITDLIVVANGEQIPLGLGGYLDIGLLDTMNDLLVNFIGAAVFSFLGYFYVKNRGKGRFTRNFIPQVLSHRAHSEEASDTAVSQEGDAQNFSDPPSRTE